jgi:hypothetical protein
VNNILIANDVKGIGHFTTYQGDEETRDLQVPLKGRLVPMHRVLGKGACNEDLEMSVANRHVSLEL